MRPEKQLLLDEIQEEAQKSDSFVIMQYGGLTAIHAEEFRTIIAGKGGSVKVIRKRLLTKAAEQMGIAFNASEFPGHIGVVFAGRDPIETTKAVFSFSEEKGNIVQVLGGRFEGQMYDAAAVEQLSKLPGKDQMRAQLLSVLEAPLSQTLATFEAILTSVIYCLENKSTQADE